MEKEKIEMEKLEQVTGGKGGKDSWATVKAHVAGGTYLALRKKPTDDDANIICKIQPGEKFTINESRRSGKYIWSKVQDGHEGWANGDFMKYAY